MSTRKLEPELYSHSPSFCSLDIHSKISLWMSTGKNFDYQKKVEDVRLYLKIETVIYNNG
jgi:hypothetical protein